VLQELFRWRFMQTDPNWGNFLYNPATGKVALIDFGAAREYPKAFVDDYLRMVSACATQNRPEMLFRSTRLGFLTGVCFCGINFTYVIALRHLCCILLANLHMQCAKLSRGARLPDNSRYVSCSCIIDLDLAEHSDGAVERHPTP
jgi:hypothetical protein